MSMSIWRTLKELFLGQPLKVQVEEMILQEALKAEKDAKVAVEPVVAVAAVNDQITDAVTQAAPTKPKRAKTDKGKFKADDKATPVVNEAWEGGKAPEKKPRAPRKKKSDAKS